MVSRWDRKKLRYVIRCYHHVIFYLREGDSGQELCCHQSLSDLADACQLRWWWGWKFRRAYRRLDQQMASFDFPKPGSSYEFPL